jgi:hypothetical protein
MKLNLLPATVSKGQKAKTAWLVALLISGAGVGGAVFLSLTSTARLQAERQLYTEMVPKAQEAVEMRNYADEILAQAATVTRNTNLATAMIRHNDKYPDLYNRVLPYVPPFYRLTQIQASAIDNKTATVTMTGVLRTYQQYADLMLALMRIRGAQTISRSGYQSFDQSVPQLTPQDQIGKPRDPSQPGPIPDDPLERLAYYQSQGTAPGGFEGVGNFGGPTDVQRGPGPQASLVQVTMIIEADLTVPNIRGTLQQQGSGAAATTASAPGAPAAGGGAPGRGDE